MAGKSIKHHMPPKFTSWPDLETSVHLMESGFSYTGHEMIVKCEECDVKIDMQNDDVISLSTKHESSCKMYRKLQVNANFRDMFCTENEDAPNIIKKDMTIYHNLMSIISAPDDCPCKLCSHSSITPRRAKLSRDMFGFPRASGLSFILGMKKALRDVNGPAFPNFAEEKTRVESLGNYGSSGMVEEIAKAGFFYEGQTLKKTTCFYCGLCLCDGLLLYDPWREHARWCPVCPFLTLKKSEQFVHDVFNATKLLKRHYKDYNRPCHMETNVIIDALNDYPYSIIGESIQSFFVEVGSFPKPEELLHILEIRKTWKTFDDN